MAPLSPNHNIPGPPPFRYFPPGSAHSQVLLVLAAAIVFIGLSEAAVHFHGTGASVEKNRPRGSRERAHVYVSNGEVAHQQLPSTINFQARMA